MDVKRPFLHQHYLLFDEYNNQGATCDYCNQQIKISSAYNCEICNFWLHKDCADELLPGQISHPRHSQHPLTLDWNDGNFVCKGCFTLSRGQRYICEDCDFKIEVLCASYTKDDALEKQGQISDDRYKQTLHFIHDDALTLCKYRKVKSNDYSCRWCDKFLSGMCYGCLQCYDGKLFIHESCLLSIPTRIFKHPFHPTHPLYIQSKVDNSEAFCSACKDNILDKDYNCRKCEFWLHCLCARPTRQPCLKHEFHQHSLSYFQTQRSFVSFRCKRCDEMIYTKNDPRGFYPWWCDEMIYTKNDPSGFYRCVQCDINFHLKCLSIPPTIQHGYHSHALKFTESFVEDVSEEYYCDICEEERNQAHPIYYCEKCNYVAHVQCALNKVDSGTLLPTLTEQEETEEGNIAKSDQSQHEIEHFNHGHLLQFYEVIEKNENLHCKACNLETTRETYGCESCKYYLHKRCAKLSHEMLHPFHPQHPLRLIPDSKAFMCDECRDLTTGFSYVCFKCDLKPMGHFAICCQCAISTTPKNESKIERESKLCFFCKDKLFFFKFRLEDDKQDTCSLCYLPILGPICACFHCNCILHESCVGFPWEIELPNLQESPLRPVLVGPVDRCDACGGKIEISYSYRRRENHLNFHLRCAKSLRRAIKSDSHDQHPLFYFGTQCPKSFSNNTSKFRSADSFKCSKCNELFSREESFYRCLICDMNFHLKCVPIPLSITSKCHIHPFSLKDYFVEDDSGKYYCDVCEEERDPKNQIYYCEECHGFFVAHIECVFNEVQGTTPAVKAWSNLELALDKIFSEIIEKKRRKKLQAVEEPTSDD